MARMLWSGKSALQVLPRDSVWDRWRETVSFTFNDDADRWSMWYLGYAESFFDDPGIGQAVSERPDSLRGRRRRAPVEEKLSRPEN